MRGILFIEPLYHQVVAGNKTQTRRSSGLEAVNKDPDMWAYDIHSVDLSYSFLGTHLTGITFYKHAGKPNTAVYPFEEHHCKPRYKVGEVLYIKEPTFTAPWGTTYYRYSEYEDFDFIRNPEFSLQTAKKIWKNKMFMPANLARAFIQITDIRCERLLDISDEDCIAEGIEDIYVPGGILGPPNYKNYLHKPGDTIFAYFMNPQASFISLYKFANKKKEIKNIWCWCYSFEYLPNYQL